MPLFVKSSLLVRFLGGRLVFREPALHDCAGEHTDETPVLDDGHPLEVARLEHAPQAAAHPAGDEARDDQEDERAHRLEHVRRRDRDPRLQVLGVRGDLPPPPAPARATGRTRAARGR